MRVLGLLWLTTLYLGLYESHDVMVGAVLYLALRQQNGIKSTARASERLQ